MFMVVYSEFYNLNNYNYENRLYFNNTNTKKEYIEFIPLFIKSWQKLLPFVDVKIILISDSIPEEYRSIKII